MRIFLFFVLSFITFESYSQDIDLYLQAINFAKEKNYNASHKIIDSLTSKYPNNLEYKLYNYRLYTWNLDKVNANKIISDNTIPECFEKYEILCNVNYWTQSYDTALIYADKMMNYTKDSLEASIKKANILMASEKYKEVCKYLNSNKFSNNKKLKTIYTIAYNKKSKNEFSISNQTTFFIGSDSKMNHLSISYLHKNKYAPFLIQYQFATANDKNAHQILVEAFPKLKKNINLDVVLGISNKQLHPFITAGIGTNIYFKKGYDALAGYRIFHVSKTENAHMIYAGFSKSFTSNTLHFRASLISQKNIKKGYVGSIQYKKYYDKLQLSYFQANISLGRISNPIYLGLSYLPTTSLSFMQNYQIAWNQYIYKGLSSKISIEYEQNKRLESDVKIRRASINISLNYKF